MSWYSRKKDLPNDPMGWEKFKSGDLVTLSTAHLIPAPHMTVEIVIDPERGFITGEIIGVHCIWFDGNLGFHKAVLHPLVLTKVDLTNIEGGPDGQRTNK